MNQPSKIICKFGVITDLQYADVPDGSNFQKTRTRYHRNSLVQLNRAISEWNTISVEFAIDLGDLLDGKSARNNQTKKDLSTILNAYQQFKNPVFFHWGNHAFYNFKRSELLNMHPFSPHFYDNVHMTEDRSSVYYHFSPTKGFRIIALDVYEISLLGRDEHESHFKEAHNLLTSKNKNNDLNSHDGLEGEDKRFLKYNGAVTQKQLSWFDDILTEADKNKERVLVTGHTPLSAEASNDHCLTWNYKSILTLMHRHPCVIAYFAGHDHDGGYAVDSQGIHHVTFQGTIETTPGTDSFAVVYVTETEITIDGYGRVPSINIPFHRKFLD